VSRPWAFDVHYGGQVRRRLRTFRQASFTATTSISHHTQLLICRSRENHPRRKRARDLACSRFNAASTICRPETQIVNVKSPNGNGQSINCRTIWDDFRGSVNRPICVRLENACLEGSLRIAKIKAIDTTPQAGATIDLQCANFLANRPPRHQCDFRVCSAGAVAHVGSCRTVPPSSPILRP